MNKIQKHLLEIRMISKNLPARDYRKISNRCDKITTELKKIKPNK